MKNDNSLHQPVMPQEVIQWLRPHPNGTYLDMTLGGGGHSLLILEKMEGQGKLIGLDRDSTILEAAQQRLSDYSNICHFHNIKFSDFASALSKSSISLVDGVLFDVGVSSLQLDESTRGFSFQKEGPLDMRMDSRQKTTAEEIINNYSEQQLVEIFRKYGEEPKSQSIAKSIIEHREKTPIRSTLQLAQIIAGKAYRGRLHPATRVFQALRIEVNQELQELQTALEKIVDYLAPNGRIVVITFHSLEDRIVKNFFKEQKQKKTLEILTKKPICPEYAETKKNPRSRSAKLRCARKFDEAA